MPSSDKLAILYSLLKKMVFVESEVSIIRNRRSGNVTSDQKNDLKVYTSTIIRSEFPEIQYNIPAEPAPAD